MKAWVHRDAKGNVLAVVATEDSECGTLSLALGDAVEVHELDIPGVDDPRDLEQLRKVVSMPGIGGSSKRN